MKKICSIVFILMFCFTSALANDEFGQLIQYRIIEENQNMDEYISRYECIVSLLKLCGFTSEKSVEYSMLELYQPEFEDELINNIIPGYLRFAKYKGIAYGVEERNFEAKRNATYIEAVAFAIRVNGNNKYNRDEDIEVLFNEAYELDIIDEDMYNKKNECISYCDWCKILNNTLNSKCVIDTETNFDYENMTYSELLAAIYNDDSI